MEKQISILILCGMLAGLMFAFTGCGSTVGWEMKLGFNPITDVDDKKGLGLRRWGGN